jgi:hypothetical protein
MIMPLFQGVALQLVMLDKMVVLLFRSGAELVDLGHGGWCKDATLLERSADGRREPCVAKTLAMTRSWASLTPLCDFPTAELICMAPRPYETARSPFRAFIGCE